MNASRFLPEDSYWVDPQGLRAKQFTCGFCSHLVASAKGFGILQQGYPGAPLRGIYICTNCGGPNFFTLDGSQYPSAPIGRPVDSVPDPLNTLYEEARRCTTTSCSTAAVLLCRKMLMNIAVANGAKEGLKFIEYVEFLSTRGYVPPNGKHWVDHIRKRGNEATHEIALMAESDARDLLTFIEMLLRFIYEFPSMVPPPPAKSS